jgi:hypothetical protein
MHRCKPRITEVPAFGLHQGARWILGGGFATNFNVPQYADSGDGHPVSLQLSAEGSNLGLYAVRYPRRC